MVQKRPRGLPLRSRVAERKFSYDIWSGDERIRETSLTKDARNTNQRSRYRSGGLSRWGVCLVASEIVSVPQRPKASVSRDAGGVEPPSNSRLDDLEPYRRHAQYRSRRLGDVGPKDSGGIVQR